MTVRQAEALAGSVDGPIKLQAQALTFVYVYK
ncbi:hypothetical protein JOE27_000894 [Pseudomonas sp. M5]|nr:hypothetical protein [Pseudomonas sp. M5]